MSAPKLAITLPVGSKWKIGAKWDSAQKVCFSQRSNAHMLLPSLRSTDIPNVAPQLRPAGSFAQPSSWRYGLGAALGSGLPCANGDVGESANAARMAAVRRPPV